MVDIKGKTTLKEISEWQGLGMDRIYQIAREKGFPEPDMTLGHVKLYDARKVERYFAARSDRRKTA